MRKLVYNILLPRCNLHGVNLSEVTEKACFNPAYLMALLNRRPIDV